MAAQKHAEDMLKYRYLAHWDSEGFKPYIRYFQYGGEGEVRENAGFIGYMDNYEKCASGILICEKVDPMEALERLEYVMVYDDASSNWGHRDNILDNWHNKVSIGIAYDDYFLALVQHFENDYIDWEERTLDHNDFIIWKGSIKVPAGLSFDSDTLFINGYYDPFPTKLNNTQLNNLPNCYTYGGGTLCNTDIVEVIMPELPLGYEYTDDVNTFSLSMAKTENSNKVDFTIKFKPSLDEEGLYTYVLYMETGAINEYLPLASYTIVYDDEIKSLLDYINN
ncbi:MAG: CAP domain-containing protein [Candidatus Nitrosothermus koennekii]|nr:MAG: CAP domain-containing protein [Candidatus Nitrosothermus koennekii]